MFAIVRTVFGIDTKMFVKARNFWEMSLRHYLFISKAIGELVKRWEMIVQCLELIVKRPELIVKCSEVIINCLGLIVKCSGLTVKCPIVS